MPDDPTPAEPTNSTSTKPPKKLASGTSTQYARMHTIIRRTCYVLLFGLVVEGALTFPLLAAWYGFPQLSLTQVCSELQKEAYSDASQECQVPYKFPGPPLAGPAAHEGQTTARDLRGVQPKPLYSNVKFREFVEHHKICETFRATQHQQNLTPDQQALKDYCNYISAHK